MATACHACLCMTQLASLYSCRRHLAQAHSPAAPGLHLLTGSSVCRPARLNRMKYSELSTGRLIGTGQFGSVRIVTHTPTGHVYALKVSLRTLARLPDLA